jgi:hypothetical protein
VQAVDYSFAWPNIDLGCLRRQGCELVLRYSSIGPSGKNLDPDEARRILDAGLDIGLVFEESAGHMLGGSDAGRAAAIASRSLGATCGMPTGAVHYFALDVDPNSLTAVQRREVEAYLGGVVSGEGDPEVWDAVVRYPDGQTAPVMLTAGQWAACADYLGVAAAILGRASVGVYGGYAAVERLVGPNAAFGWQTYAWSGGRVSTKAHLYQYDNGNNVCGGMVDYDSIRRRPYGGWLGTVPGDEFSMATIAELEATVRRVLNEGTATGQANWASTCRATLGSIQGVHNQVSGVQSQVTDATGKLDDLLARAEGGLVDVPALAVALEEILGPALAGAVADEMARRLRAVGTAV